MSSTTALPALRWDCWYAAGRGRRVSKCVDPDVQLLVQAVVFMIFFILFRGMCGKCGGRPDKSVEWGTASGRRNIKIAAMAVGGLIGVGFILGYSGNNQFASGLSTFSDDIVNGASHVSTFVASVNADLAVLDEEPDASLSETAQDAVDGAEEMRKFLDGIGGPRTTALHIAFIIPLLATIFTQIALVTKIGALNWGCLVLGCIGILIAWSGYAIHYIFARILTDVCYDTGIFLGDIRSGNLPSESGIATLLPCFGRDETEGARESALNGLTGAIEAVNIVLDVNDDGIDPIPLTDPIRERLASSGEELDGQVSETGSEATRVETEIAALPDAEQADYEDVPESLRKIRAGLNALTNLDDITSCSLIGDVLETVTESLCTTVTSALDRMLWGFGLCGGLLVLAVAISIKGMKAFLKPPEQPQQKELHNGRQPGLAEPWRSGLRAAAE